MYDPHHWYRAPGTPENHVGVHVYCPPDFALPIADAGEIWPIGWDSPDVWARDSAGHYWLFGCKSSIEDIVARMKEARWTDVEVDDWLVQVGEITADMAAFNQKVRDQAVFTALKEKYGW